MTQTSIEITQPGASDVLQATSRPLPEPTAAQVLIKVAAAGINRPDVFQRMGFYPPPPGVTDIPGLEVSGTVVAVGEAVTQWKAGDKVCALLAGGGYAEYAVADDSLCLPIPQGLDLSDAAALPETCFTVWHNLFERAALKAGEWLLVHGGASGIGTTAIQMASAMGVNVIATAGSDKKCAVCEELGAVKAINYHQQDFVAACQDITGSGVNVILDMVGGDYVQQNFAACAPKARIVNIAFLRGSNVQLDLMPLMLKQLVLTGSTLRAQPLESKARIAAGVKSQVWPLIADGKFKPMIHSRFALADAAKGHALMETNQHIGKILLEN
ncbi:MAG: NAD(P)H-quinone oxidoreductase [Porticoccaceae bacterium]|mgnify:CR=1 FL=1|jgi:NADPH:quinone reductase|nr:NAD(P)H-quinone oxidoreductase [Porticoccaceae bacterium]MBT5578151.1 NAD(P)H-quinone oxidoreductase [Porticoccaceae bacterium]